MAAFLFSSSAQAYSAGQTDYSGKTDKTCMMSGCHGTNSGSPAPTVTLDGPATLEAGATGNYKLIITGGPGVKGGMNVAMSTGTLGTPDPM